jgi:phosphate transport system substrate-binding protein
MKINLFGALFVLVTFVSCELGTKLTKDTKETVVTGTTTILVDETIFPIVEDVVAVFENEYKNAKINLISKPEGEIVRLLKEDKSKIAILARNLSRSELQYYSTKNIIPRVTEFGEDAVVFIAHKSNDVEAVTVDAFASKLKGASSPWNNTIVFETESIHPLLVIVNSLMVYVMSAFVLFSGKVAIGFAVL